MGWIKWYPPHSTTGKGRQIFTNLSMIAYWHCVVVTYCWVTHYTKTIITEINSYHLTVSTDQNLAGGGCYEALWIWTISHMPTYLNTWSSAVWKDYGTSGGRNKLDEAGLGRGIEDYNPTLHLSEALSAYCPMKMWEAPDATMNSGIPSPPQQTVLPQNMNH